MWKKTYALVASVVSPHPTFTNPWKKQCISVSGSTIYHSSNENMQMFWCLLCSIHFGTLKYVYILYRHVYCFRITSLCHRMKCFECKVCVCVCACATHKGVHSKTLPAPNSKFLFSTTLVDENLVSQVHKKRKLKKLPFWMTILIPYIPKTPGVANCGSMPGHKTKKGTFQTSRTLAMVGMWVWLPEKRSCNSESPTVHGNVTQNLAQFFSFNENFQEISTTFLSNRPKKRPVLSWWGGNVAPQKPQVKNLKC